MPIPAFAQDIQRLEVKQLNTYIKLLEDQFERADRQRIQNLVEQDKIKRSGQKVPDVYIEEQAKIETQIKKLDQDLAEARARLVELSK